jgi:hypothetical protein
MGLQMIKSSFGAPSPGETLPLPRLCIAKPGAFLKVGTPTVQIHFSVCGGVVPVWARASHGLDDVVPKFGPGGSIIFIYQMLESELAFHSVLSGHLL